MNFMSMNDSGILEEIGRRIQRERLNQNMSQEDVSRKAGVSRRALQKLEAGFTFTMLLLIRILRALNKLDGIDSFLPEPGPSPIQLAKLKGKLRARSSGHRRKNADGKA
jgi:putative transcriptional regulator